MGKTVSCQKCSETYRNLVQLEDLRDNDGICLVCNAPIEVADWDRVLASYLDDDLDDVDDIEDLEPSLEEDDWDPDSEDHDDSPGLVDDEDEDLSKEKE